MWLKKGIKLLEETVGDGPEVLRLRYYILAIRIAMNKGEVVISPDQCLGHYGNDNKVCEDGFFVHCVRVHRENHPSGIYYAIQGMKVGGCRKVSISPHLAYGENGIPGVIPSNAKLTVEIKVQSEADPS